MIVSNYWWRKPIPPIFAEVGQIFRPSSTSKVNGGGVEGALTELIRMFFFENSQFLSPVRMFVLRESHEEALTRSAALDRNVVLSRSFVAQHLFFLLPSLTQTPLESQPLACHWGVF